jgi:peroxiredoxin
MKKVLLLLMAAITVVSCNKVGENEFIITGKADGIENGVSVFLQKQDSTGLVQVDTVKVKDGKFKFEGKVTEPGIHLIEVEKIPGKAVLVLENGEITLDVRKDTIGKSKVGGTYSNDQLTNYSKENEKINKRMMAFQNANMAKFSEAQAKQDTVTVNALLKENGKFQKDMEKLAMDHMEKHPKSYLTVIFLQQSLSMPNADMAKLKKIYENLDPKLKATKEGKKIKKSLETQNNTKIGSLAPDFSGPNPEGKTISLKESMGKLTIVDFWASWCAPCRQENPNVVALYKEFHDKGLNIVGVSLDREGEAAKWKEAIAKDGLTWTQISNLKFWDDPIAQKYNVKSIPATFLIDASGKIIATDLRGAALRAKVAAVLGS